MRRVLCASVPLLLALTPLWLAASAEALAWTGMEASGSLWRSRDLYVRMAPQEKSDAPVAPNAHPAHRSPDDIRALLKSVQVRLSGTEAPAPVFTEPELAILGDAVARGLSQATPKEDIVFAIAGYRRVVLGTLKEPRVTTGRIFFHQRTLNIIFREIQGEYQYLADRRLESLLPGSRNAPTTHAWTLVPQAGQKFSAVGGANCSDWLLLDPDIILAGADQAREQAQRRQRIVEEADQLRQQISEWEAAQQELKQEVETLQKDIRTLQQKKPSGEQPSPSRTGNMSGAQGLSYEERLSTLRRLRDKGLLSEREYQAKRQEILDEL